MARARASIGITTISEPLSDYPELTDAKGLTKVASSSGLKRAAPHKHGGSSDLGSKDARKIRSKVSCHKSKNRTRSMSSHVSGDKRVDPELEQALHQLEIQRRAVEDNRTEKEKTSPKSNISSQSSVMKTRFGEDSLQLYNACLLPTDQTELASMAHCTLEEIAAHDLMRVN